MLRSDLVICPLGYGLAGGHEVLFDDDFVCVVSADHTIASGELTVEAMEDLDYATTTFVTSLTATYYDLFESLGVTRRARVVVDEWAALPLLINGTDLAAVIPRRLARRACPAAAFTVMELPVHSAANTFTEAVFWHPSRASDRGLKWMRERLHEAVDFSDSTR